MPSFCNKNTWTYFFHGLNSIRNCFRWIRASINHNWHPAFSLCIQQSKSSHMYFQPVFVNRQLFIIFKVSDFTHSHLKNVIRTVQRPESLNSKDSSILLFVLSLCVVVAGHWSFKFNLYYNTKFQFKWFQIMLMSLDFMKSLECRCLGWSLKRKINQSSVCLKQIWTTMISISSMPCRRWTLRDWLLMQSIFHLLESYSQQM